MMLILFGAAACVILDRPQWITNHGVHAIAKAFGLSP